MALNLPKKPKQSFWNKVRDTFDANTEADYYRREQAQIKANQPVVRQTYAQQQTNRGIGRVSNNAGQRTVNAVKSVWEGFKEAPEYVGKGLSYGSKQQQSTDQSIISQQNQRTQELARARMRLKDPTLSPTQRANYSKFVSTFGSDQDKRNAQTELDTQRNIAGTDPVRGAGYVASMGFDVLTAGVGGGAGATLKTAGKQGAKQFFKTAATESLKSGAVGAGSGALQSIGQKGRNVTLKDVGEGAAIGGAIGTALPVAGYGLGRAGARIKPKVTKAVTNAIDSTDPADSLVKQYGVLQRAYDIETNPKLRKDMNRGMADLNRQIREVRGKTNQGGYIKNPLANDAPQGKPTGSAPLKLQKKIELPEVTKRSDVPKTSIDPSDPFGNKNIINRVRNELGGFIDDDAQMINMLKKIEKETGQKGLVDQWYFDSTNVRKSNSMANARLRQSDEINQAFGGLDKNTLKEFDDYAAARAELKNYAGKKTSRESDELARIVQAGEATYGKRFQALNQYYKNLAKDLYNAGIIDKDKLGAYLEADDYVRIQRDMDDLVNGSFGSSGSRSFGSTSTKQKRTGSKRDIRSVSTTTLERTQQLEAEIQRNKAASNIIDVLLENGLARPVKNPKHLNTISRFVDGKVHKFEVAPDMKRLIDNVSPYQLGIIARIASTPSRLLRAGTTALSAPFSITNYARDQASSAIVSKSARATHKPTAILSGLGSAIRDFADDSTSPLWKKFEMYAGDETVFNELRNADSTKRMMRELTRGKKGKYTNMAVNPIRTLEDFNGITEKATRFQNFKGMYEKVLKETGNEQEALKQAVNASRQNSVDFSRNSKYTRVLNLIYPYFNASVQGSRTVGRSFVDRPVATTLKAGLLGSTAVALAAYNLSDPKRREAYDSINDFEKEDNLIIVGPDAVQREDGSWEGIIKIPKPQGFRELVDPMRDVAEAYFRDETPENVDLMLTDMLSAFTGPIDTSSQTAFVGSLTPQAIKPSIELNMNKNLYTGKDIVPEFMVEGTDDPTKRAYDSTSGSARWVANKLGVSPIQVEHFIKGTAGSVGLYGLNTSDNILAKTGKIPEEQIGGRSAIGDIQRRTVEASGELLERNKTPGRKYFENIKTVSEGLAKNDKTAFDNLHQSKTNFLGEEVFDENKRISKYTRAGAYLNNPNVLEADRQLDALNRQNGNPGNPLFDLPTPLLTKVLLKDALPPGAKDPELSNLFKEEWYQDYQNARGTYYEQIKSKLAQEGKEMPKSTNPYPTTPEPLQRAMDAYSALPKGTGERSAWINANPGLWQQMTAQWAQVDAWENKERVAIGLAPVEAEDSSTSKYGGYGSGGSGEINSAKYLKTARNVETAKGKITKAPSNKPTVKRKSISKPKVSIKKVRI